MNLSCYSFTLILWAQIGATWAAEECVKRKINFGPCEETCTVDKIEEFPLTRFPNGYIHKTSSKCSRLFSRAFMPYERRATRPQFTELPKSVRREFFLPNTTFYRDFFAWDEGAGEVANWTVDGCAGHCSGYGTGTDSDVRQSFMYLPWESIRRVAVIGSRNPWLECFVWELGNRPSITTLEYGKVDCEDCERHGMRVMQPETFFKRMLNCEEEPFDLVVSYSSIEHSGLGRYWDPINPWGDIEEVARIHCMLKESGILVLAVPANAHASELQFNAHRVYGPDRYRYLTANFKAEEMVGHPARNEGNFQQQPVIIFRRLSFSENGAVIPTLPHMELVKPKGDPPKKECIRYSKKRKQKLKELAEKKLREVSQKLKEKVNKKSKKSGCAKQPINFGPCGETCRIDQIQEYPHSHFPHGFIHKSSSQCSRLFSRAFMPQKRLEKRAEYQDLSEDIRKQFLLPGTREFGHFYALDEGVGEVANWTLDGCSHWCSGYGQHSDKLVRSAFMLLPWENIRRVAVIGSRNPWLECFVWEMGNRPSITTLEYGVVNCTDCEEHNLRVMQPEKFYKRMLNCEEEPFDLVVSYSSIEHSGLGRYWDPINPWGDIEEVARVHCMLKESGILVLGVPTNHFATEIHFNAHRVYGPDRYRYLTANFMSEAMFGIAALTEGDWMQQPVVVLRRLSFYANGTVVPTAPHLALVKPKGFPPATDCNPVSKRLRDLQTKN